MPWLFSEGFFADADKVQFALNKMLNSPRPQSAAGYAGQLAALLRYDTRPILKDIKCPTTVIAGGDDRLTPSWLSMDIANGIESAEYIEFDNMGHMVPIERPLELVDIIRG